MRPPLWHPPIELSDTEALIIKRIKRGKLFTFLRLNRSFIFNDEFQEELATIFKDSTVGQSPVPPAQLALAIILQAYLGISDDEVIEEIMMDQRWQLVLDCLNCGFFRTYYAKLLEKCQLIKALTSKLLKFLNPNPQRFNNFNLLLIPFTLPLVVLRSKYPTISPNHRLIVGTLFR